jgi:DNA-binding transcriptional MerR regulator
MTTSHVNPTGNTDEHELLTIIEAADLLRTPVATLRYWRSIGYGPGSFRVGRVVRYWRHEIIDWLHRLSDHHEGPLAS